MSNKFVETTKKARAQLNRRPIDSGQLTVAVSGSVIYITGVIRPLRGSGSVNLEEEMKIISQAMRSSLGVAEVVWDVIMRV